MSVLILLSTYNGERYLAEQIDSIFAQSFRDWILLIRDDGSSDRTLEMIGEYIKQDDRVQLLQDDLGNLNSRKSFSVLMKHALSRQEEYVFFADQDDVWLPQKLEKSVSVLKDLETLHGKSIPALVHTDLRVVDQHLELIHESYIRFEQLKRNTTQPIKTLLINNYITGCTMGINRALLQMAVPVPDSAFMHDWWCALCASTSGHIGFVNEATILYRQHGNNSIGSTGLAGKLKELATLKKGFGRRLENLKNCFKQAEDLLSRTSVSDANYRFIESFVCLPDYPLGQRYGVVRKLGLQPASWLRAAVFILMIGFV